MPTMNDETLLERYQRETAGDFARLEADLAAKDAEIERLKVQAVDLLSVQRDLISDGQTLKSRYAADKLNGQREIQRLRAELAVARSALTKADIEFGTKHGCHCDLEEGAEPDDCVFEHNAVSDCRLAMDLQRRGKGRDDCHEWRPVVIVRAAIKGKS